MGTGVDLLASELIAGVNRCNYNQGNLELNALAGKPRLSAASPLVATRRPRGGGGGGGGGSAGTAHAHWQRLLWQGGGQAGSRSLLAACVQQRVVRQQLQPAHPCCLHSSGLAQAATSSPCPPCCLHVSCPSRHGVHAACHRALCLPHQGRQWAAPPSAAGSRQRQRALPRARGSDPPPERRQLCCACRTSNAGLGARPGHAAAAGRGAARRRDDRAASQPGCRCSGRWAAAWHI